MDANENVYYLNIANQRFVPTTVFCLKSLQILFVRSTSFYQFGIDDDFVCQLPAEIELLAPSLLYLGVYDSTVTHLPEQIGRLTRLYSLDLFSTGLVVLPDSFGNLSSLQLLGLSNNKLTSLPTTIINIRTLYQIILTNNVRLRSVQSLNGLSNLQILNTDRCPIERIPLNLPGLYVLQMNNNNLTDLVGIRTLGNNTIVSKQFYFKMNHIRLLPPQIGYVRNLYRLDLDQNELASLPLDIFNVTTLRYLDIRNNLFSGTELRTIAAKFNATNPSLSLHYLASKDSSMKSSS
jgi:leucine-rich repeat protein SHOC2